MGKLMGHILQKDRERMWLIRNEGVALDYASFKGISFLSYHYFQENRINKSGYPTIQLRYYF